MLRIPLREAVARVMRGEIRDSISVAALLCVALMVVRGELPDPGAKIIAPDRARAD